MSVFSRPQDPAIATSKRIGNTPYDAYDRGTLKNAWVMESDGKTPLLGEVSFILQLNYEQKNLSIKMHLALYMILHECAVE